VVAGTGTVVITAVVEATVEVETTGDKVGGVVTLSVCTSLVGVGATVTVSDPQAASHKAHKSNIKRRLTLLDLPYIIIFLFPVSEIFAKKITGFHRLYNNSGQVITGKTFQFNSFFT
jgi:hypothetical protein